MTNHLARLLPPVLPVLLVVACSGGRPSPAPDPKPAPTAAAAPATVAGSTVAQNPNESIEQILAGRVAGVTVSRAADGGIAVRIRGATSYYGNNEPLYILDGVPYDPGPNGSITGVSPYDIESIKVLKDAADVALYGARGANGVILIRTKRAKRQ